VRKPLECVLERSKQKIQYILFVQNVYLLFANIAIAC